MTLAELVAALRRGETIPPEMLAAIALPKRGRPRRSYEKRLADATALIERVETLSTSLGTRQRAINALASGRMSAATVETYYRRAKRLERVIEQWIGAWERLTEVIKNTTIKIHSDEKYHD
jgi:hypothetical protein